MTTTLFPTTLLTAAFSCALVGGILFAFAVVVMPGISALDDREFLRAFQVIDAVIQRGSPLFFLVWLGSAVAVCAAAMLGLRFAAGAERVLLVVAAIVYVVGVQLPTITINVPMNNAVQRLDVAATTPAAAREARLVFESRWNRWNLVRLWVALGVTVVLLVVVQRV